MRAFVRNALRAALVAFVLGACAQLDDSVEVAEHERVVCGDGPTVEGIDVSVYQGTIDWDAVAASGIRYAIVRIGDGLGGDTQFTRNWAETRRVGLLRGAYQFFRPMRDPVAQADIVIAAVGVLGPGDLPVTIDVEAPDPGVTPAAYTAAIHTWVDRVTAGTGRVPIVYTGRYYWDPYVASSDFVDLPLWHAQYTSAACPNINDRWSRWAFWQYTSTGSVPGISGNVDRDRWNGTYEMLEALADVARCTPHCEGTEIVDASCDRGDCAAFAAYCSTATDPATPRCVSVFCVPSADDVPIEHEICLPSGQLAHCNADGAPEDMRDCDPGTTCMPDGTGATCAAPLPDAGPVVDAGPGDAGVSTSDASPTSDGGTTLPDGSRPLTSGCGCRAGGTGAPTSSAWLFVGLGLVLVRRSRRRRGPRALD